MPGAWTECLRTGWEPFDREHLALVGRLEELLSAVNASDPERTQTTLDDFVRDCGAHFGHEERLMAQNGYGQLSRHREAHDLFLADVGEHAGELAAHGISPTFRRWATGRVLEWFRFHVSANDVALGAFLVGRRKRRQLRDEPQSAAAPDLRPAAAPRRRSET